MMAVLTEHQCDPPPHSLLLSPAWLSLKCKAFPCSPPDQATPPRLYSRSSTKIALLRPRTTSKYLHVTPRQLAWAAHATLPPWLQQLGSEICTCNSASSGVELRPWSQSEGGVGLAWQGMSWRQAGRWSSPPVNPSSSQWQLWSARTTADPIAQLGQLPRPLHERSHRPRRRHGLHRRRAACRRGHRRHPPQRSAHRLGVRGPLGHARLGLRLARAVHPARGRPRGVQHLPVGAAPLAATSSSSGDSSHQSVALRRA
jgi:hypothetical protein